MKLKRWHTYVLGFVISILALYLAYRQVDFAEITQTFREARYEFIVLGFSSYIILVWLRGLRWSVLTEGKLSISDAFWLFNIGFLFNNILPARLGEIARAVLAGRRPNMHFTSAISTIVVERLLDMISVAVMAVIVLLGADLPDWARLAGAVMGFGALAGIIILAFTAQRPEGALKLGVWFLAILPVFDEERAEEFLRPFVEGLGGVSNLRVFAISLGLSIFAWLMSGAGAWVFMKAFVVKVPFIDGILAVTGAGLGVAVPAAPSGIGPFHAAVIGVLTAVGYSVSVAGSIAFLLHASNTVVTSILGIIGLMREGVTFREVAQAAQAQRGMHDGEIAPADTPSA